MAAITNANSATIINNTPLTFYEANPEGLSTDKTTSIFAALKQISRKFTQNQNNLCVEVKELCVEVKELRTEVKVLRAKVEELSKKLEPLHPEVKQQESSTKSPCAIPPPPPPPPPTTPSSYWKKNTKENLSNSSTGEKNHTEATKPKGPQTRVNDEIKNVLEEGNPKASLANAKINRTQSLRLKSTIKELPIKDPITEEPISEKELTFSERKKLFEKLHNSS